MAKTICFTNQKGGVGKTASAQQLICYLASRGKKVLAIDLDAQWNLSMMFGLNSADYEADGTMAGKTIYQLMKGKGVGELIVNAKENIDFICGSVLVANADREFAMVNGYTMVRDAVSQVKRKYDYVIIDCPPTCSLMTVNGLIAADGIVIPYKADSLTKAGVIQLKETIDAVKKSFNSKLKVFGILVTMFDKRTNASKNSVMDAGEVASLFGCGVFESKIRVSSKMRELADEGKSIFELAPNSPAAVDYGAFCEELIKELEK